MKTSPDRPPGHRKKDRASFLLHLGRLTTSLPALAGISLLVAAGALALVFSSPKQSGQGSAVLIPSSSPLAQAAAPATRTGFPPTWTATAWNTPVPSASLPPTTTPSPRPTLLPSAEVAGLKGRKQTMPLSCEASSAVDWAAYFGIEIDEGEFFDGLPRADNPEEGFVGDVYGSWGQVPPDDYGVHAGPVAQRLREYGLNAKSLRYMTLEDLKREIAAGRPVIVWVVGHVNRGTPVPYTSPSGEQTTVAKFEHTVIVTGYTGTKISVLDGAMRYSIYEGEFLKSWGVLENQAVIWID